MVTIIAEIGVNWNTMPHAKKMIALAKKLGADMAKFQYFRSKDIKNHPLKKRLLPMVLTPDKAKKLIKYGKKAKIMVFFTPENFECIGDLEKAGNPLYKISHVNYRNFAIINAIARTNKDIIISVPAGRGIPYSLIPHGYLEKIKYLYCNTSYPTHDINVKLPEFWRIDGFSDHTRGITASIAAAARGARVIEIHFKLNNKCIDTAVSKSPKEFKELVEHIRRIEKMVI
jgi:sialic acid synthase SpsE